MPDQHNLPQGAAKGPKPCITGPSKCKQTQQRAQAPDPFSPERVQVVAWGVDALYTTYQGELRQDILAALEILKAEAQQDDTPALFAGVNLFGEPLMVHQGGGVKGFTYHVSNSKCDAFLVGRGKNQPALWVQPKAEFLREVGPVRLVHMQRKSVEALFDSLPQERANRLDLHADLEGVTWNAFGLTFDEAGIVVGNATTRGKDVRTHASGSRMTAFTVGKRSGSVYLRVYDKTQELQEKGHLSALSGGEVTHYLPELWRQNGWKGQTDQKKTKPDKPEYERVIRVEFELGREALSQFLSRTGQDDGFVDTWDRGLAQVDAIWQYCVLKWFVVREPGEASQKTRWQVAGWWEKLAALPMVAAPQVAGARVCQRSSSLRKLGQLAAGVAVSLGALDGLSKCEAIHRLVAVVQAELAVTGYVDRMKKKTRTWRTKVPLEHLAQQEGWSTNASVA